MNILLLSLMLYTTEPITLCYRGRTIHVPAYLASRWLAKPGTTAGPCPPAHSHSTTNTNK